MNPGDIKRPVQIICSSSGLLSLGIYFSCQWYSCFAVTLGHCFAVDEDFLRHCARVQREV